MEDLVHTKFLAKNKVHITSSFNNEKDNENWLTAQIITGVQNESQQETGLLGVVIHLPSNGIRTQMSDEKISSAAANSNDELMSEDLIVINYDNIGNCITRYWVP